MRGKIFGAFLICVIQAQGAALFTYNGFASTAGLTLVGNAATTVTGDGTVLRLASATGDQSGAVYSTTPVTLGSNNTFSTQFQFRFTNPGGWDPADGITFVLGTSTTGLGNLGVGMGYEGVSGNSIAIEFDTYNNTGYSDVGNDDGNSSNHVAIDMNGVLTDTDLTNVYGNPSCGFPTDGTPDQNNYLVPGCMSNGDLWTVNITYDGALLTVVLTDPAEGSSFTAISNYPINLATFLGQSTAYVGFTSGTGAGWENHDIVNWTFINTQPVGVANVVSDASFTTGGPISTGSWVAIFGTGLAPLGDSRTWNTATEIVNGKFPVSLDGTSVTVNGKPAAVEFIQPTQVNIQPPDDTADGPVKVVVTTAAGTSNSFTTSYAPFAPGLFGATAPYIVAQHADFSYVTAASPAKPGEVIVLWGTGFGPANPPVPAGQIFSGANPLASPVTVTIGGEPAAVDFAGVVGAGLVQINVHVPSSLNNGDAGVVATTGGASTQTTANMIPIHN